MTGELRSLSMPHARFEVRLDAPEPTSRPRGRRRHLRFTADRGRRGRAAARGQHRLRAPAAGKGASGGELSRVMLAIEVALADTRPVPTFVFDEVDAGVGGKAAVEIGRRLAALARSRPRCWS